MKLPIRLLSLLLSLFLFIHTIYADETPPPKMQEQTYCQGETAKLSCPNGTVISIQLANYGRFSVIPCNSEGDTSLNVACHNDKTMEILKNRCQSNGDCVVPVEDEIFGDVCPETKKYLEVNYICIPAPQVTTTTTTTTPMPTTTATLPSTEVVTADSTKSTSTVPPTSPPKFCPSIYARHIQWPRMESGSTARVQCPIETQGTAEWYCSTEGKWEPSDGADLSRCVSTWSQKLALDVEGSPQDASLQLETLKEIYGHSRRQQFVGGELIKITSVIKKVVDSYVIILRTTLSSKESHTRTAEMNKLLVDIINHSLSPHQADAWSDINVNQQRDVASSLLDSSEKLLAAMFPVASPTSAESSSDNFVAKPHVKAQVSTVSIFDYVLFPSMPMSNDIAHVPREALEVSGRNAQVVYSNVDGLQKYLLPRSGNEDGVKKVIASKILTVSVVLNGHPQPVRRIAKPVVLSFHLEPSSNLTNPQCVWWDTSILDWSTNGCTMQSYNGSFTVCECSHLTHFAILMDVRGIEIPVFQEMLLTVITYVGCLLSIVCLLLSFLAFFVFGDSQCDRNSIHMNLSLTLAIGEIVFLLGIYRTDDRLTCTIVGAVLQYLFLSAFCWMLLEGFQLYFMLVQVFSSKRSRKPYLYLFAYGLPAIVSAASFYLNPEGFGTERHCWLSTEDYFIWSFVGPAAAILFCNVLFLLMTFFIVCKHSNVGYKPCKHDFDTIRMIRAWLKGSFALVFLLGLTWTLGFFWIDQKTVWVAYVFTVFNTLQGVFIFVFHIWLNDKMHIDYENWVRRNDWLPSCLRDPTLNVRERRTGPYLPSTATSSAHTSDSSHSSDRMHSQSTSRKGIRDYRDYDTRTFDDTTTDPLLFHGQCPNCSHSTTILYSASNTLRGGEKPLPPSPDDEDGEEDRSMFYSPSPQRRQRPPLASINFPGQQWTLDRFGPVPTLAERQLYNVSLKEAMKNSSYPHHRMSEETYDYATIPCSEGHNGPYAGSYRSNFGVDIYPTSHSGLPSQYPRAPPTFKPPPPPQISGLPLSDDSAYSDSCTSSSRSPNSAVSRNGTMLLRMDLTKNPPVFCEDV